MNLRIACPGCKTVLAAPEDARGKQIRCPKCAKVLAVPAATVTPAPPIETPSAAPTPKVETTEKTNPAIAAPSTPAAEADFVFTPEKPAPPKPTEPKKAPAAKKSPLVLVLGGVAAVLVLCVCVGPVSLGIYWFTRPVPRAVENPLVKLGNKAKDDATAKIDETKNTTPPDATDPSAGKPLPAQMPEDVIKRVKDSTAYLRVTSPTGQVWEGSGFFAVQPGIVVTNAHVLGMLRPGSPAPAFVQVTVNSGEKNEVKLDGTVIGVDRLSDLGIVQIGESPFLPVPLFLESERRLIETQKVYIFGFPYGKQLGSNITISESSISSLRKNEYGDLAEIQVNGGMNPGNSGGPVVNSLGNVVGVAVSVIKGTSINFAVPSETVRGVMEGRIWETTMGEPYLQGAETRVPVRFKCVDPLKRIREVRVDVFTGAPGQPRPASNQSPQPMFGDSARQTHAITYKDGIASVDVPLPKLPAGQVYLVQPIVATKKGTRWESPAVLSGPIYPVERKSGNAVVSLTAHKERTVKLKSSETVVFSKGKESKERSYKIEADILEVLTTNAKGAMKQTSFGPTNVTIESGGKVVRDAEVSNVLRQLAPVFLIDATNQLQGRQDRPLAKKMNAALRQDVEETYLQFRKSMEAALMPLPNRTLEPNEKWDTSIPISIRAEAPLEFADLDVKATFEGTRTRDGRAEGVITFTGEVKGRGLMRSNVGGKAVGKVAFDLTGGYISEAQLRLSSSYDLESIDVTTSLDVHLTRAPGNPLSIAAPAKLPTGPVVEPGGIRKGKSILQVAGELAATDAVNPVPMFKEKNAHMKLHPVALQAGKTYAISLKSAAFDAYVMLESPKGEVVAEDDDGDGFPNSLLLYAPKESGMFRIRVTSFDGQLGAYQLSVLEIAAKK